MYVNYFWIKKKSKVVAASVHEQAAEFSTKNQRRRFLVPTAVSIHFADSCQGVL